jgi:hypothetical protein
MRGFGFAAAPRFVRSLGRCTHDLDARAIWIGCLATKGIVVRQRLAREAR